MNNSDDRDFEEQFQQIDKLPDPTIVLTREQYNALATQSRNKMIQKMVSKGFSPETIAATSGISINLIYNLVEDVKLTPEEESVAEMARIVMMKSLAYCLTQLETGSPEKRMAIAMRVLPTAMKLIGRSESTSGEMEAALKEMLGKQRVLPDAP